jgi:hypothetical protein
VIGLQPETMSPRDSSKALLLALEQYRACKRGELAVYSFGRVLINRLLRHPENALI